jgi:hypothetical protein
MSPDKGHDQSNMVGFFPHNLTLQLRLNRVPVSFATGNVN